MTSRNERLNLAGIIALIAPFVIIAMVAGLLVVIGSCRSQQSTLPVNYWTAAPLKEKPSPPPRALPTPSEAEFGLGENLSEAELKVIHDRVNAESERRHLGDEATMELSTREIGKASRAQWQRDGRIWFVRN